MITVACFYLFRAWLIIALFIIDQILNIIYSRNSYFNRSWVKWASAKRPPVCKWYIWDRRFWSPRREVNTGSILTMHFDKQGEFRITSQLWAFRRRTPKEYHVCMGVSHRFRGVIIQWIRHFSVFLAQNFFSMAMFNTLEKHWFQCFVTSANHIPEILCWHGEKCYLVNEMTPSLWISYY